MDAVRTTHPQPMDAPQPMFEIISPGLLMPTETN